MDQGKSAKIRFYGMGYWEIYENLTGKTKGQVEKARADELGGLG